MTNDLFDGLNAVVHTLVIDAIFVIIGGVVIAMLSGEKV